MCLQKDKRDMEKDSELEAKPTSANNAQVEPTISKMEKVEAKDVNNIDGYIDRDIAGVYDVPKENQINSMEDLNELSVVGEETRFKKGKIPQSMIDDLMDKCEVLESVHKEILPFKRTKSGVVCQIFSDQKKSCNRRNHDMPNYTRKELKQWMYSKSEFHEIYNKWKNNGFAKYLKPSIDRLNDSETYSFGNIQIITWGENKAKGHRDIRSGKLTHGNKPQTPIIQYDLDGSFIAEYVSQAEAHRQTGISQGSIGMCCRGEYKQANGFIWKYKKDCEIRKLTIENKELKKCIAQQQSSWQKKFNKLLKDN